MAHNRLFTTRDLRRLFIPLLIEQFLAMLVGLADTVMVSATGEEAVGGVSLIDNVMMLMMNIFAALATGGAVVIGQYLGRRQKREAGTASGQLVLFAAAVSLGVMLLLYLARPLVVNHLFGNITAGIKQHANTYLLIVAASIPAIALYNAGAAVFRAAGNSRLPMLVALLMDILNIAGNAALVYGFGMGVTGVAIATLASRWVAAVVMLALAARQGGPLRLEKSQWRYDSAMVKRILAVGAPYGVENGLFQLGRLMVLSLTATFGTAAITANAVVMSLAGFQVLPGMAINMGHTTVVARCVGAGEYGQARYYNKRILQLVYASQLALCVGIMALLPLILRMYNLSAETASLSTQLAWIHTLGAIVVWPLAYTVPVTLRAAGDASFPMAVSVASMFVCRVGLAYVLGGLLGLGVAGTYLAMLLDWVVKAALLTTRYRGKKWTKFRILE